MKDLKVHRINKYVTLSDVQYEKLDVTYEVFGQELHTAPIIIVFHALTGNSDVASEEKGWWKELIGFEKAIDLNRFTVISFNILGNGYDGNIIENYSDFIAKDIAILSFHTVRALGIKSVYAVIGGSLGGGIAWELVSEFPKFSTYLFAIATDWKSTDWVLGFCGTQENILKNSEHPLADARRMAMLFYRSPDSLQNKFKRKKQDDTQYAVNSWLNHHGFKLKDRFSIQAYLMMNNLLQSVDITRGQYKDEVFQNIQTKIIQISISSDLLYLPEENRKTAIYLDSLGIENYLFEINSKDGHDAFLIENRKIGEILEPYLKGVEKELVI
jgi:homoserine O-acetyltransferase